MVAVVVTPTDPPVTIPEEPTLATPEELLLHVPPVAASDNEVVNPEHTLNVPNIAVGNGFTVTTVVMIQPVDDNAYVIVAVLALNTAPPVTKPALPTDAISGALLLHIPPPVASLNDVVKPEHTLVTPRIAVGKGYTVTTVVVVHPEPSV